MIKLTELLYIRLIGYTASFRIPTLVSGTQLSLPVPTYTHILGIISYALDRKYSIHESKIGFRYNYFAENLDLETVHRWARDSKTGRYKYNETNPRQRQVHYKPCLEIFTNDFNLEDSFRKPKRILSLGRSQDIVHIDDIQKINVTEVSEGLLFGSLLPFNNELYHQTGTIINLPIDFDYSEIGQIRKPIKISPFFALDQIPRPIKINNLVSFEFNLPKKLLKTYKSLNLVCKTIQTIYLFNAKNHI